MAAFEERVAQVQLIKAFGQESRETAAVDAASRESYRSTLRMLAILFVLALVLAPVCSVLIGYSLYYLMMQVIAGRMTLGDVVLLASYGSMLANPMAIIGSTWASVQASVAGLRRVHSVLDNLAEPVADGRRNGLNGRIGRLEFSGVAIGYGATTVLTGVTMSMRAGEMVALGGTERMRQDNAHPLDPAFCRTVGGNHRFRRHRLARGRPRLDSRARRVRISK